jgi:hypothetical protein
MLALRRTAWAARMVSAFQVESLLEAILFDASKQIEKAIFIILEDFQSV